VYFLADSHAHSEPRLRPVEINGLASSDANYVRLLLRAFEIRRDNVDVMTAPPRFAREEMHVLADSTEMRIVVLGDESDSERSRKLRRRERLPYGRAETNRGRQVVKPYRGRHERRLVALSARGMENRRHSLIPYRGKA